MQSACVKIAVPAPSAIAGYAVSEKRRFTCGGFNAEQRENRHVASDVSGWKCHNVTCLQNGPILKYEKWHFDRVPFLITSDERYMILGCTKLVISWKGGLLMNLFSAKLENCGI